MRTIELDRRLLSPDPPPQQHERHDQQHRHAVELSPELSSRTLQTLKWRRNVSDSKSAEGETRAGGPPAPATAQPGSTHPVGKET